jgi:glycosyltransferase involved in cell wall biosynthesis
VFAASRVNRDKKVQLRSELGFLPGDIVVVMISRVIRSKGVLEFMTAAREIKQGHPNIRFLLVGPEDKNNMDRLNPEELAELKQHVVWTGARQDVPDILAMSDIFVLPSAYREGVPRVLLEAASMGLPIVTTNSPGCKDVVEDGANGYLVPVRDPEALKKAVLQLVSQPGLCRTFGQVSRKRAVERFEISVIADQTSRLYRQMISG